MQKYQQLPEIGFISLSNQLYRTIRAIGYPPHKV